MSDSKSETKAPRVQWEYMERTVGGEQSPLETMNTAGEQGWEFIYVRPGVGVNAPASIFFKRRKQT